jgi:hypothetical protein
LTGLNVIIILYSIICRFSATRDAALLRKTNVDYVKPEQVKAFELGYRSFISDVSVDINGYYNIYNDFIGNLNGCALLWHSTGQSVN